MRSVDGGWSEWSHLDACSAEPCSQQIGFRIRFRSCTSPSPQFGGLPCQGRSWKRETCYNNDFCTKPGTPCRPVSFIAPNHAYHFMVSFCRFITLVFHNLITRLLLSLNPTRSKTEFYEHVVFVKPTYFYAVGDPWDGRRWHYAFAMYVCLCVRECALVRHFPIGLQSNSLVFRYFSVTIL